MRQLQQAQQQAQQQPFCTLLQQQPLCTLLQRPVCPRAPNGSRANGGGMACHLCGKVLKSLNALKYHLESGVCENIQGQILAGADKTEPTLPLGQQHHSASRALPQTVARPVAELVSGSEGAQFTQLLRRLVRQLDDPVFSMPVQPESTTKARFCARLLPLPTGYAEVTDLFRPRALQPARFLLNVYEGGYLSSASGVYTSMWAAIAALNVDELGKNILLKPK
jgi:hypothetical protein